MCSVVAAAILFTNRGGYVISKKRQIAGLLPLDKGGLRGVKHVPYNRKLTNPARENRNNPTEAEKKLWAMLKRRQFAGLRFTRQKPLDQFIADFYCAELLLTIEVDGDSHVGREQYDVLRSDVLKRKFGIECIRYSNSEILGNADGVFEDLLERIEARKKETPSNSPLSRGGKRKRNRTSPMNQPTFMDMG